MKPIIGQNYPDPIGQLLGTGYMRFQSPTGICGLAKDDGERLDILAVDTLTPGKGQFRHFINEAKKQYSTICIWEIWNPWLEPVLLRYGFTPATEIAITGETLSGVKWDVRL